MTQHRPSPARTGTAGTAAALVLGYLAGIVLLSQLLVRLVSALGPVAAYAVLVALILLGTAGYVLFGRRFAGLDDASDADECDRNHVQHAKEQVDGQVAMLVRVGVDEDKARELVRDSLVRALTPRSGHTLAEFVASSPGRRGHPPTASDGQESAPAGGGTYL